METPAFRATDSAVVMLLLTFFCQWRAAWLAAPFSSGDDVLAVAVRFLGIVSWNFVAYGVAIIAAAHLSLSAFAPNWVSKTLVIAVPLLFLLRLVPVRKRAAR